MALKLSRLKSKDDHCHYLRQSIDENNLHVCNVQMIIHYIYKKQLSDKSSFIPFGIQVFKLSRLYTKPLCVGG